MIKIRVKLTMVLCDLLLEASAYGAYRDPIAKTNINPKTDLFEKEIEDYGTFRDHMGSLREQAARGIASPGNLELISDKTDDEIKAAASDLNVIKASDLQVKGQEEVLRTDMMELHVDYTDPLIAGHQKDAFRIAEASGMLLGKLTELFKEFGIDCRTVKGNKVIEPEYYIDVKKEQVKDTVYTRTMCEELRNRYSCHDVLTTKCKRRGAVGELKHVVIDRFFVSQLLEGTRRLGYDDSKVLTELYGTTEPLHLLASSRFIIPEGHVADMVPYSSIIKEIIIKSINTDTITVPPHRWYWPRITRMHEHDIDARIHRMAVQKRTGEWYEEQIIRIKNGFKLYYYDEGCVEWVDEWDEVCGLEP